MKYCPITYEAIAQTEQYSKQGLKLLSYQLTKLEPLELSAVEQRAEALARVGKMSIGGIQAKLSAQLKIKEGRFTLVDKLGHYLLKPQSEYYSELPENEALTMTLASSLNLEVPLHGLLYSKDHSMTYFIKRFDRVGQNKKLAVEDFAQLLGGTRDSKYNSSMEKVAKIINTFCSFPRIEAIKLVKLLVFNFLIGNEDMHLKNFSLITRDKVVTLSPVYDLVNSTIIIGGTPEEIALPLNGKKNNLTKRDFMHYFSQHLHLDPVITEKILQDILKLTPGWQRLIEKSFMSANMQKKYLTLLEARKRRLT